MQTFKGTGLLLAIELSLSIKTNRYSVVLGIHLDNELFKVKDSFTHALPPLKRLAQYLVQNHLPSSGTGILGAKLMTLAFLLKLGTNQEIDKGVR